MQVNFKNVDIQVVDNSCWVWSLLSDLYANVLSMKII